MSKTPRKDALRSRDAVLHALEEMYADDGVVPGMHALAARAGVGVATLYRHFPTRDALMATLATSRLAQLVAFTETAAGQDDTGQAIHGFLTAVVQANCDPALVAYLSTDDAAEETRALLDRFEAGLGDLLARAHADGVVRPEISHRHLVALLHGLLATVEDLAGSDTGAGAGADRALAVEVLLAGLAKDDTE